MNRVWVWYRAVTIVACAALAAVVCMAAGLMPTAVAAEPVPQDVEAFFADEVPDKVAEFERQALGEETLRANGDGTRPRIADTQVMYLVDADADGVLSVMPSDQWVGGVYHGDAASGTASVYRNADGELEAGWSDDADLAGYLAQAAEHGDLVQAPWLGAYFLRADGKFAALNAAGKSVMPEPLNEDAALRTLQTAFDEESARNRQQSQNGAIPVDGAPAASGGANGATDGGLLAGAVCPVVVVLACGVVLVGGAMLTLFRRGRARGQGPRRPHARS